MSVTMEPGDAEFLQEFIEREQGGNNKGARRQDLQARTRGAVATARISTPWRRGEAVFSLRADRGLAGCDATTPAPARLDL